MRHCEHKLIGVGMYTPAEAARLTGIRADRVYRWIRGYKQTYHGELITYPPLWKSQVILENGRRQKKRLLGFRDLMEIRVVDAFNNQGVKSKYIRDVIKIATRDYGEYPLSTMRFRTDGKELFVDVIPEKEDGPIFEFVKKQHIFKRIISPILEDVEFDGDEPKRWWVIGKDEGIIIDPERSFGHPIDDETGVPTFVLFDAVELGRTKKSIADEYEISLDVVSRAVEFERNLRQAA